MKTVNVCKACWGNGRSSNGAKCCAVCQGVGAKIPVVTPGELAAATPAALASAIKFAFVGIWSTRFLAPRVAMATFIAMCARYQTGEAQTATLVMLRGQGFTLLANATEAAILMAEPMGHAA